MNIVQRLIARHALTQEQLAEIVGVSRPTVVKIISGQRELRLSEAKALAEVLGISTAEVLGESTAKRIVLGEEKQKKEVQEERISVPAENVKKFKNALLYITQKIGAQPNVGQTVLYKILYFCDFDYYEKYEEQLIGAKYMRNHYGPTPIEFGAIVKQMIKNGEIEEVKTKFFDMDQTKYLPVRSADVSVFTGRELQHINEEIERFGNKTATEISDFSHRDTPWLATPEGEIIDYESVFYRTPETSVRNYGPEV